MHRKILRITETAVLLAMLIALQAVTRSLGQLVTGTCVNAMLALTVLLCGPGSGLTVAALSPVAAFALGIAPQIWTVPAIIVGNCLYVVLLSRFCVRSRPVQLIGLLAASAVKFAVLYALVTELLCGVLGGTLIENGLLKEAACRALPAMFSWRQLVTALLGGAFALLLAPLLRKALKK